MVISGLPPSVRTRLGGKAGSVKEGNVCVEVAKRCCGVRAGLIAALEVFEIPIQCDLDYTVEDILWYVAERYPETVRTEKKSGNSYRGVPHRQRTHSMSPVMKYRALTVRYARLLRSCPRLPRS
jgi:hypothetical protein